MVWIFFNFNIFENNIIIAKAAKILWYVIEINIFQHKKVKYFIQLIVSGL
jgi:hypothetical protein